MAESLTPLERAALYRFLAEGFWGPPDPDWTHAAADLPELAPHLAGDLAGNLATAYTEAVELNVYPYASVYLDPSGMLDAPWTAFTAGVYRALGLSAEGLPDHLSAHLEALALLLEREADAATPLAQTRARHGQRTLLTGHLLPWLPCFAFALSRADTGLYAALARLTLDAALEHAAVEDTAVEHAAVEDAPAFAFPEPDGEPPTFAVGKRGASEARQALQALLTPARSGLFLSRADIGRVAAGLGLGTRFGERSFMLEGVLGAAAESGALPAALGALQREARVQAEGYGGLQAAYPALAPLWTAWREKLAATEAELERGRRGAGE